MSMFWAAAYTVVTGLCIAFALGERRRFNPHARVGTVLLLMLALVAGFFALEEAFGLMGSSVTGTMRQTARDGGWYRDRRELQRTMVAAIVPSGACCLALLLWITRKAGSRYLPLAGALTYLICFGVLQAISLHQWDVRLRQRHAGITLRAWGNAVGLGAATFALIPFTRGKRSGTDAAKLLFNTVVSSRRGPNRRPL